MKQYIKNLKWYISRCTTFYLPLPSMSSEKKSVDQRLHDEVYSTHDLLLQESTRIINNSPEIENSKTLDGLVKLGFYNAEEVREFYSLEVLKESTRLLKQKIEYYQFTYPNNRFIDETTVSRICKKYDLLLSDVTCYISNIPDKNKIEIVNFRISSHDIREDYNFHNSDQILAIRDYRKRSKIMIPGYGLLIIAPEHKLNTTGKLIKGNNLIKDPVVLQPVIKGYLIVSSWGFEASDDDVVNSKHN